MDEEHPKKTTKKKADKKSQELWNVSGWGIVLGIVLGYAFVILVSWLLGYLIALAIYAIIFILLVGYSQEHQDRFLKGVAIGGLGLILGAIIYWIISLGSKRTTGYKLIVSVASWLIIMTIGVVITAATGGLSGTVTVNLGSIYNYSAGVRSAICQNDTIYLQSVLAMHNQTGYTVDSAYCVGDIGYMTETAK